VGNHLRSASDIPAAMDIGRKIPGITGLVAIVGEQIGMWGDLQVVPLPEKRVEFLGGKE